MTKMSVTVPVAFDDARSYLATHARVDGEAAGAQPITIRWLNKKNTYVNIGMEEFMKHTMLTPNHNSYGVTHEDLCEVADDLTQHFKLGEKKDAKAQDQQDSAQRPSDPITGAAKSSVIIMGRAPGSV